MLGCPEGPPVVCLGADQFRGGKENLPYPSGGAGKPLTDLTACATTWGMVASHSSLEPASASNLSEDSARYSLE